MSSNESLLCTSGCADLDKSLFGGIPNGYAVLLTSTSSDARDLLVNGFLEEGIAKGECTFLVTSILLNSKVRTLARKFQSNFSLFVCSSQSDAMLERLPNVFKLKGVEQLTDISIALASAISKTDSSKCPKRACIGIISDVLLQHKGLQTRRWLNSLISDLKLKGFTILGVMNSQMHPPHEVQAIPDLFEGELEIYEKKTENGIAKILRIKKMADKKYLEKELFLRKEGVSMKKKLVQREALSRKTYASEEKVRRRNFESEERLKRRQYEREVTAQKIEEEKVVEE